MTLSFAIREYVQRKRKEGHRFDKGEQTLILFLRRVGDCALERVKTRQILEFLDGPRTSTVTWRGKHSLPAPLLRALVRARCNAGTTDAVNASSHPLHIHSVHLFSGTDQSLGEGDTQWLRHRDGRRFNHARTDPLLVRYRGEIRRSAHTSLRKCGSRCQKNARRGMWPLWQISSSSDR